jgi:hypothetical protein
MACYFVTVTPRHVALAVLGAAVLLAGVYLFHEVRTTPAAEGATQSRTARAPTPSDRVEDHDEGKPAAPTGTGRMPPKPDTSSPSTNTPAPAVASSDDTDEERANPSIDAVMDRANKAYDRSDFEEAKMIAGKVLSKLPTNIRMMRIMVSASCIDGDVLVAQKWFEQLPKPDREQMKMRCDKYGVSFKEPPQ